MQKKQQIRNSTAEFLIFAMQGDAEGIEVRLEDDSVWLTQQMMASLYGSSRTNVLEHIQHIYAEEELDETATCRKIRQVRKEGNRNVNRETLFYNLDVIIAVGYRVNSKRATQFRQWATTVLRDFAIRGYVLDRKRMENGKFLGQDYFEHLLAEIREIRLSERRFYQKITDIYATSMDYDAHAPETRAFYAKVQNKLHYAVHGHTAAGLVEKPDHKTWDLTELSYGKRDRERRLHGQDGKGMPGIFPGNRPVDWLSLYVVLERRRVSPCSSSFR